MTEKVHSCGSCKYKTSDTSNLNKHINTIHNNKVYPCSLCEYKASASQSLKQHMMRIHNQGVLNCTQCSEKFSHHNAQKRLKEHLHVVHNISAEQRNIPHYKSKLRHLNDIKKYRVTIKEKIPCPHCSKTTTRKQCLERHLLSKHFSSDCEKAIRQILNYNVGKCPLCPGHKGWTFPLNWISYTYSHFSSAHKITQGLIYSDNMPNQDNVEKILNRFV